MQRLENFLSERVVKHRTLILLFSLLVVVVAANGLKYLSFDNDYRGFFGKDNPDLIAYNYIEETYTKSDNVFLIIEPKKGDVFQPEALSLLESLTKAAWQLPYSRRVDSLQNFQHTYAQEDDLIVENLFENAASLTSEEIKKLKQTALSDPLLFKRLVSEDGRVTGINITLEYPGIEAGEELKKLVSNTRQMVQRYQSAYPAFNFYITGVSFLNTSFVEAGESDVMYLVPISFLLMMLLMFFLLKSASAVLGVMLVIIFSDIIALGAGGYLGIQLAPPSVPSVQVIMVLAVASSVHILVAFVSAMRQKMTKPEALAESVRINLQPIFLTSVTTIIGFLGMNFSEAPPFNDLGNLVAIGVFASLCLSLFFLPAMMSFLPVKLKADGDPDIPYFKALSQFVIKFQNTILLVVFGIVLMSAWAVTLNKPEDQFVKYFDETMAFRADSDFATKTLGGLYQIVYSIPAEGVGGISEPEYLKNLDKFVQWYKNQPEVINVYALTDTLRQLNKNMHGDDPAWYKLPESRNLAAQYLLLYEMSLPYGLDLNNQINVDKSATRLVVSTIEMSNIELLKLEKRVQAWLSENMPNSMQAIGTGPMMMFSHITEKNINGMLKGSILALVAISMILVFALRSFNMGVISLVPNLVPILIGFGLWGLTYVQVNMALAIVVSMTLGIVVDDTVHFLSKYLRGKREKGLDTEKAVSYAFTHVGKAMVVSTLVLSAGFSVLMLSPFALNADMSRLTVWIIVAALIVDFLLLPALLLKLGKGTNKLDSPL